jgi:hypothetical protein
VPKGCKSYDLGALSTRVARSKVANVGNRLQLKVLTKQYGGWAGLQSPRCTCNVTECYTGHWVRFCEHDNNPSGSTKLGNFYLLKDC